MERTQQKLGRHARPCAGIHELAMLKDVDGRDEPAHDAVVVLSEFAHMGYARLQADVL